MSGTGLTMNETFWAHPARAKGYDATTPAPATQPTVPDSSWPPRKVTVRMRSGRAPPAPDRHLTQQPSGELAVPKIIDIAGRRFGHLLAINAVGTKGHRREICWLCLCDCGTQKSRVRSCGHWHGCAHGHARRIKRTPEHQAWS